MMKMIIVEINPPPSFQEIRPARHPRAGPSIAFSSPYLVFTQRKYEKRDKAIAPRTPKAFQQRLAINLFAAIVFPLSLEVLCVFVRARIDTHYNAAFLY